MPGHSGNPSGKNGASALKQIAKDLEYLDDKCKAAIEEVLENGEHKDKIACVKLVYSYRHGLPRQVISGDNGGPVMIGIDLAAMLARLAGG